MESTLRFWGVRGSLAAGHSKVASHTSCVELDLGEGHSIFFDAGTGIHPGTLNRQIKKLTLCLSHFHWDHIQGFPFLNGLYQNDMEIEVLSGFPDTFERMSVLFDHRFHPVPVDFLRERVKWRILETGQSYELNSRVKLSIAPLNHPGTSFAFRCDSEMTSFVYATDSDYDPMTIEGERLLKQADVCVMDSQFLIGDSISKAHYGHSSFKHTIDTAANLKIRDCVLFHFDPHYTDEQIFLMEAQAQDYVRTLYKGMGPKVSLAREGLEMKLGI